MRRVSPTFRTARRQATWIGVASLATAFILVAATPQSWRFCAFLVAVGLVVSWFTLRAGAAAARRALREEQHWISTRPLDLKGFWDILGEPLGDVEPTPGAPALPPAASMHVTLRFAGDLPVLAELFQKLLDGGIHQVRDLREVDGLIRLVLSLPADAVDAELSPMLHRLVDGPLEAIRAPLALRAVAVTVADPAS